MTLKFSDIKKLHDTKTEIVAKLTVKAWVLSTGLKVINRKNNY